MRKLNKQQMERAVQLVSAVYDGVPLKKKERKFLDDVWKALEKAPLLSNRAVMVLNSMRDPMWRKCFKEVQA